METTIFRQKDIAERSGVTQQFISKIMNGHCRPGWKVAKRLAAATGTTPYLWLEGSLDEIKAMVMDGKS